MTDPVKRLIKFIEGCDSIAIAFSGGVDSSFLAAMAVKYCKGRVVAVTAVSEFQTERDVLQARNLAAEVGIAHHFVDVSVLESETIVQNNRERCYYCKKKLLGAVVAQASLLGIECVCDGANTDDLNDFRPGFKAVKELGVQSPLVDAGFGKSDIRRQSKQMKLSTWDKPSQSCLATRIPYGTAIKHQALIRIAACEAILGELGFHRIRVRCHGTVARIEVEPEGFGRFSDAGIRQRVIREFKKQGFDYVCLDLEGYVSGSMNIAE